ncbi:MAG TPA: hypothetical protein VFA46_21075 [Actinomycetes bacterium]|jgi:hypothetical protein|nr:hypothetical protein [Actinomycetes bacterium]
MSTQSDKPVEPVGEEAVEQVTVEPVTPRDAAYWAVGVETLQVGALPPEAVNLNVAGRRLVGPVQGFGKLWQKTYRVDLGDASVPPAEVIRTWKENFQRFWPARNWFYGPLTGIAPGEVALLNLTMPGRLLLSTGVLVLYADGESFTFMTPEGHIFAAWITFSAARQDGRTVVQVQVLLRAGDPLYELALAAGGHRKEDRFWQRTLTNLAAHFGAEPPVETTVICVDRRRQWSNARNVWHNAAVRSAWHTATRWLPSR